MHTKWMIPLMIATLSLGGPALAGEGDDKAVGQAVSEARLEGQLWATYSLNRHLNPFEIAVDVEGDTAVLTGRVENPVQKELAEQIAIGTDGIARVDNRIEVVEERSAARADDHDGPGLRERVSDLTTTATVKSKLLWNRNTQGLSIDVSTEAGRVILEGTADSEVAKELAGQLAANTDGVAEVDNRIVVDASASADADNDAGDAVSDGWITAKVKSTLLFSSGVSGTAINVDTRDGVVTLAGDVESEAEKELAVRLAKDIRGVARVEAGGLVVNKN